MLNNQINKVAHTPSRKKFTHVLSFTSGKGGVGKTTMTCNLALRLAQLGKKVLVLDGDFGMANVDIFFGVRSVSGLQQVLRGEKMLKEILVSPQAGIFIIPGGSGIYEMNQLSHFDRRNLLDQIEAIQSSFDYLLIDTAPGIADNVLYLNSNAELCNVILTPDPSSFADSYALVKVLNQKYHRKNFNLICNQVKNNQDGLELFEKFLTICDQFLNINLDYLGSIPFDEELRVANRQQRLILKHSDLSLSSQAIKKLATQLEERTTGSLNQDSWRLFWEQAMGVA